MSSRPHDAHGNALALRTQSLSGNTNEPQYGQVMCADAVTKTSITGEAVTDAAEACYTDGMDAATNK